MVDIPGAEVSPRMSSPREDVRLGLPISFCPSSYPNLWGPSLYSLQDDRIRNSYVSSALSPLFSIDNYPIDAEGSNNKTGLNCNNLVESDHQSA